MKRFGSIWYKILAVGLILVLVNRWCNYPDGVYHFLMRLGSVFRPFLIAALIALVLYHPASYLEKRLKHTGHPFFSRYARGLGIGGVYAVICGALFLAGRVVLPAVYRNAEELLRRLPEYYHRTLSWMQQYDLTSKLQISETVRRFTEGFFSAESLEKYVGYLSGIANSVISLFTGLVVSVYMLLERESLLCVCKRFLFIFVKDSKRGTLMRYLARLGNLFYSYFTGLGLDALLVGLISVPFFYFFKVPYAVLYGVVIGICNMIPFFGPIIAGGIIFLVSLLSAGPVKAIWILVFQVLLGQLDAHVFQPRILSNAVGISPFWVIFAVLVFGELWGISGMILGVPLVAVARVLFAELEELRYQT